MTMPAETVQVCWLQPHQRGEVYLPTLISAMMDERPEAKRGAVFKPAKADVLREYIAKHNMVKRKCLLPQLLGEPLVLWYKAKPVMPAKLNGLAVGLGGTALEIRWTGGEPTGIYGLALLVRSSSADGLPTADVFDAPHHEKLLNLLQYINDATLPYSDINLKDEAVVGQLATLWPAYNCEPDDCDTLKGGSFPIIQKYVGDDGCAVISTRNVAEYLADPKAWMASQLARRAAPIG